MDILGPAIGVLGLLKKLFTGNAPAHTQQAGEDSNQVQQSGSGNTTIINRGVSGPEFREIIEAIGTLRVQPAAPDQESSEQEANAFEFRGRSLARQPAVEEGTWTPGLSYDRLMGDGYARATITDPKGNYWIKGKAWEVEGWFTATLPPSTETYRLGIGVPFSLNDGKGLLSVECEAPDGSVQVANNIALKPFGDVVPLSIDLIPGQTYKFHILADFESDHPFLDIGDEGGTGFVGIG